VLPPGDGGKEQFSAVLYGKITNTVIASRGDSDQITNNIDDLALSVVGESASQQLTDQLGGVLGEKKGGHAEALGSLTNVAIASGWDATAINTFMNGPLIAALGKESADLIPERFGSAGEFLGRALERLTQSYRATVIRLSSNRTLVYWRSHLQASGQGGSFQSVPMAYLVLRTAH